MEDSHVVSPSEEIPAEVKASKRWPYLGLMGSFAITLFLQAAFLPCMCKGEGLRIALALLIDFTFLFRTLLAFILKEQGNSWIYYLILLCTSPLWIRLLADLLDTHHHPVLQMILQSCDQC